MKKVVIGLIAVAIVLGGILGWKYLPESKDTTEAILTGSQGSVKTAAEEAKALMLKPDKDWKTNGLAICMYHYVYDPANPPEDLNNNFISTTDLREELDYLVS